MKVLGITGGVGSGKSTVLEYLHQKYGAKVIQADQVGHLVMEPGQSCYYQTVELFGSGVLSADGIIDRDRLAEIVFHQPELLAKLTRIIHPAVKEHIVNAIQIERRSGEIPFVVIEAALLIEDNYHLICDELWYIYVAEEVRRKRLKESRGYTDEKITEIFRNQLSDREFRTACQWVVDNSSDDYKITYEQIERGLKEHEFV